MKRKDVSNKVRQTLQRRIESGELVWKHGPEHHSWKGNRGFNLDCRSRLYVPWIKHVLKRDGFFCTMCGKGGKLQVHHVRTLRKIISIVLQKNSISDINLVDKKSLLYSKLMQDVIDEHQINDGITLCANCHSIVDDRYRRYKGKGENKKNI